MPPQRLREMHQLLRAHGGLSAATSERLDAQLRELRQELGAKEREAAQEGSTQAAKRQAGKATAAKVAKETAREAAAGAACARLPPRVPRFRTCGSPMAAAGSASAGHCSVSTSEVATS